MKIIFASIIFLILSTNFLFAQAHYNTNFREIWSYNTLTKQKTLVERKDIATEITSDRSVFKFNPGYKLLVGCAIESDPIREDGALNMNVQGTDGFKYLLKISEKNFTLVCTQAVKNKMTIIKYGITKVWIDK